MKRPLAGLLASAAAVPGAWFLVGADEQAPSKQPVIDPPTGDVVQPKAAPAERLAGIEPTFGGVEPPAVRHDAIATPSPARDYPSRPEPTAPDAAPLPAETSAAPSAKLVIPAAAELPAAPVPTAANSLSFIAEPVVQQFPAIAVAALSPVQVTPQPTPAPAALAKAEPAPAAKPERTTLPAFVAEPIVQILPAPVLAAAAPSPVQEPPVRLATEIKVDQPALVRLAMVEPIARTKPVAAPVVTKPVVAAAAAPAPLVAKPATTPSKPVARQASAKSPEPVTALAIALAPARVAATPPASAKQADPAPVQYPAAKLLVGEVVLASFSPNKGATSPAPATKTRSALVETTAARTIPVGAPAPVTYPEPAFGPPEPKLIPAAYSSVEAPDQPASLGSANTLAQAIAYSYETNPRLLAERASTRAADMGYPAARAAFGPRLDASASLSYTRDRDEILPGSFLRQQGWSDTASLILSQPLLTFGRSQAQVGQATATIDYRREALRLVQNEVMLDVIGAYVGTLREAGAVTIARENVTLLQRQLDESNARFAVREITLADVQQVETRLALGKTVLLDAQARLGEIQSRFYRAVGMPPGELAPPEPLTLPVASLPEAYSLADSDSPLVRAAQARERISRSFLAATRAESAPRVDFRGSADYGAVSDYSRDLRGTRVRGTVTLSVPLFDSGARSAESGQAREANTADLQLIAAAQRDSRSAVATGWNNLLAARMSIDHYRQAVESAQRAYENAQRQERAGMRTTLDVLDLARDLLNVRNAYNAALATEYETRASLLASLGRLDPAGMAQGIKLYDPADHFRKVRGKGDIPLLTGTLAALDGVTLPNLKTSRPSPDTAALVGTAETVTGE